MTAPHTEAGRALMWYLDHIASGLEDWPEDAHDFVQSILDIEAEAAAPYGGEAMSAGQYLWARRPTPRGLWHVVWRELPVGDGEPAHRALCGAPLVRMRGDYGDILFSTSPAVADQHPECRRLVGS